MASTQPPPTIHYGSLEVLQRARVEAAAAAAEGRFVEVTDGDGALVPLHPLSRGGVGGGAPRAPHEMDEDGAGAARPSQQQPQARETLELSESSRAAQEAHALALIQLEAQRRARGLFIPTDPAEVKLQLRALGHPVTLFGEGPGERRTRLRGLLGEVEVHKLLGRGEATADGLSAAVGMLPPGVVISSSAAAAAARAGASAAALDAKPELFYTPGPDGLLEARGFIAQFSFERASKRLRAQAAVAASADAARAEDAAAASTVRALQGMSPSLSQPGDDRPLTSCSLTHDGALLATGSWGSAVKVWDVRGGEGARLTCLLRGHADRVVSVAWHPGAGGHGSSSSSGGGGGGHSHGPHSGMAGGAHGPRGLLVTGSTDTTAKIWRVPDEALAPGGTHTPSSSSSLLTEGGVREVATLSGHAQRLCSVGFHPSGAHIATTSFDTTWRLWDVETAAQLLLQEGHTREVYALAFHPDGSLVATGDLGGLGRVWDLRSGKSIFLLRGHVKQLLALDFSPNGYHVASGSDDNTCIVWELRQQRTLYTIPAHSALVSTVKFAPASGEYLLSASYDGTVKAWSARDWSRIAIYKAHEGKVTDLAITPDERHFFSTSFDRTFKYWAHDAGF